MFPETPLPTLEPVSRVPPEGGGAGHVAQKKQWRSVETPTKKKKTYRQTSKQSLLQARLISRTTSNICENEWKLLEISAD